jgi:NADH-quinone oxidoreductase subunit L
MLHFLWLIPALPLAGFVLLALAGARLSRATIAGIGAGSVGVSAVIAILVGAAFIAAPPPGNSYSQVLWQWINVPGFTPAFGFYLDPLSLVMALVVTFVAFWIHLYSTEFMIDDEGYSRFFAYMNLFVASMLILVLGSNLLLLYLGWEGVGLCSYLLIGFWYRDPANGAAAQKAFIVTRIGDTAMAIGLFLLMSNLGTLDIQALMHRAAQSWPVGSALPIAASALLLGGALGKSAQLPLQTWLPDAMAGPTPVSALIHAATMVTAGVYLIARTHVLFALAPPVQAAVAAIGAATLLVAGASALVQRDIKRVLAYSTISQIGYMFLALGVGAWSAAIFHFMTHAFFKSLLFLGAGAIIMSLHHEHDIYRMGGLRRKLPVTFWTFLIASAALAGFPLVTAGFYSKDLILWHAWSSTKGSPWLWAAGLTGAFLTGIYIFRVVFVAFYGEEHGHLEKSPGLRVHVPLVVLAVFAAAAGFVQIPGFLGGRPWFTDFLQTALPPPVEARGAAGSEMSFEIIAGIVALIAIYLAYLLFLRSRSLVERMSMAATGKPAARFLCSGWGFDRLYDRVLVRPFLWFCRFTRDDFIDSIYDGIALLGRLCHLGLSSTETGRVRWYAAGIIFGSVVLVAIAVLL